MRSYPRIGIVGAGLGGCAAAALLDRAGYRVTVFEQSTAIARLGAGIHLSPNVTRVLDRIGVLEVLAQVGAEPDAFTSRSHDTGELTARLVLGARARRDWGAPYLTVHRGDFHALLLRAVPSGTLRMGKRLRHVTERDDDVELILEDGSREAFDIVIGADGVNSRVREILLGPEAARYGGYVAHRSVFPAARLSGMTLEDCTKWWSDSTHLIVYFLTRAREEFYVVTGVPVERWDEEGTSRPGNIPAMREAFAHFEPRVQAILDAIDDVSEWALLERPPLPLWSRGRIVMLGDACHPMKPHMGQGAAMAIEDAAMLVRCLEAVGPAEYEAAFELYRSNRIGRASEVQAESGRNRWLRHETDPSWVFGYDVFKAPLAGASLMLGATAS